MRALALLLLLSAAPLPAGEVQVDIAGLRSAKGQVLACLTADPRAFPDCRHDASARKLAVPAPSASSLRFAAVAPGTYAVALLHDENGNGKADMVLMLPREGYGFSRDAAVRMGPPRFAAAAFTVADRPVTMPIKMRYFF